MFFPPLICLPSSFEPRHNKTNKVSVCPHKKHWVLSYPLSASKDSYQTGRMPRLIWVFAGRRLILLVLSCRGSIFYVSLLAARVVSVDLLIFAKLGRLYGFILRTCECCPESLSQRFKHVSKTMEVPDFVSTLCNKCRFLSDRGLVSAVDGVRGLVLLQ